MQALYTAAHTRVKSKAPKDPWWTKPHLVFCVPAALFWLVILYSYTQFNVQLPGQLDVLSKQDKATIPCNSAHRPVVTCAHRGDAAELLGRAGSSKSAAVLQQMQLLWQAGIMCFDMDVVRLRGGDMIIGHPADLAAQADPAALPTSTTTNSSAPEQQRTRVTADELHTFSLQELRAAGLTDQAAPALQAVLQQFRELLEAAQASNSSSTGGSNKVLSVQDAMQQRSWVQTPLISLEPKGPAAADAQAFIKVSEAAAAAGVSQHTVLWLRQMPAVVSSSTGGGGSGSGGGSSGRVLVTELAQAVKQGMSSSSNISAAGQASALSHNSKQRPLLGLIVADMLLQQHELSALQKEADASKLTAALLATAGGVFSSAGSSEEGAAVVLDAFDVLAPSIKLPPRILHSFVTSKPCLAWTLEHAGHTRKAMWLGIDVAITNTPIAQLSEVQREKGTLCNS